MDGDASTADGICAGLQIIQHATSLGAVESTIEGVEDLWADLERAVAGRRN